MNCKYEGIGWKSAVGLLCMAGMLTACEDDFGKESLQTGALSIKVAAPQGWTSGVAVDEDSPDSRCVSVDATTSDCSTPLYLHTIEADNAVAAPASRGALKDAVEHFSMSAICYTGDYDESWTPNFAYDLTCTVNGNDVTCPEALMWPAQGKVRFFAFAPVAEDGSKSFSLSGSTATGTPKITYTVPSETARQLDLMAACTDARSAAVNLKFHHILTAVKIVAAKDMIPGTITAVRLSGVYDTGTYTAADGVWTPDESSKTSYTITRDVTVDGGYKQPQPSGSGDLAGDRKDPIEVVGTTDDLTLLMIPQTLPAGAKLEIDFTEALSGNEYTLSADLTGTWPEGKIVIYSISPSSIHITPVVEFNKKQVMEDTGSISGDILPYSGVWSDVEIKAYATVTRVGDNDVVKYIELPIPAVKYSGAITGTAKFYDSDGNEIATVVSDRANTYADPKDIPSHKGMLVFEPQPSFSDLQGKFGAAVNVFETGPINLFEESGNESANTYMVGKPGYYKFPVVYGNSCKGSLDGGNTSSYQIQQSTGDTSGMKYYVDYRGNEINGSNYKPESVADAKLAWQDSPDLIDDVRLSEEGGIYWVTFRVSKHTINQGNALIVVRDTSGDIIWSWQIWVTQHTDKWMAHQASNCSRLKSIYKDDNDAFNLTGLKFTGYEYYLTDCNLGYCDPHSDTNDKRMFRMAFDVSVGENSTITLTSYKNEGETCDISNKDFEQAEFKGSRAGDNTYYQWGRKDPMLGGIYNSKTPVYYFGTDYSELNMENKPVFNVYNEKGVSYDFNRNRPGTDTEALGEENGVDIMWTIKNPYKFVMSKYHDKLVTGVPNYRDHWHKFFDDSYWPGYAKDKGTRLFQMWNAQSKGLTDDSKSSTTLVGPMKKEEKEYPVVKTVYDPCPSGYHIPPAAAFSALAYYGEYYHDSRYSAVEVDGSPYETSITWDSSTHTWTVEYTGGTISFPATGVRNKSPRYETYATITLDPNGSRAGNVFNDKSSLGDISLPAFRMLTYITGSSMGAARGNVDVFYIDNRLKDNTSDKTINSLIIPPTGSIKPAIGSFRPSADSYGLSVRPALDNP